MSGELKQLEEKWTFPRVSPYQWKFCCFSNIPRFIYFFRFCFVCADGFFFIFTLCCFGSGLYFLFIFYLQHKPLDFYPKVRDFLIHFVKYGFLLPYFLSTAFSFDKDGKEENIKRRRGSWFVVRGSCCYCLSFQMLLHLLFLSHYHFHYT